MLVRTPALLSLLILVAWGQQLRKRYDGYQIWEVHTHHETHVEAVQQLEADSQIIVIRPAKLGHSGLIIVGPDVGPHLNLYLSGLGANTVVHHDDIQRDIDAEYERLTARYDQDPLSFDPLDFNTYDAVMLESAHWVDMCPKHFDCSVYSIGRSYEGRNMGVLSIKKTNTEFDSGSKRKVLWFTSTIHAREWLSMTTIQNIIIRLLTKYGEDKTVSHLLDNYDFYFLLVANPDGYVYTWDPKGDRLWRKNRRAMNATCVGADLNRNFNNRWGKQGASHNACEDTYPGTSPASEIEVRNIQNEATRLSSDPAHQVVAWYPVHCCGQMWMFPYSFTQGYKPKAQCLRTPDYADLLEVADGAAAAMKAEDGSIWKTGTICEVIYPATGSEAEYTYGNCSVKYSWALELHGTSFVVDKSKIKPIFEEFWAGFVGSVKTMEKVEGWETMPEIY